MAEQLTLTTTVPTTGYRVRTLVFNWAEAQIKIEVVEVSTGLITKAAYNGSTATTLMIQLNKANLSTQSLQSRVLQRLAADGLLPAGTVTGTPD